MVCLLYTLPRQSGLTVTLCINGCSVFYRMAWQGLQTNQAAAGVGGCTGKTDHKTSRKRYTTTPFGTISPSPSVTKDRSCFSPALSAKVSCDGCDTPLSHFATRRPAVH